MNNQKIKKTKSKGKGVSPPVKYSNAYNVRSMKEETYEKYLCNKPCGYFVKNHMICYGYIYETRNAPPSYQYYRLCSEFKITRISYDPDDENCKKYVDMCIYDRSGVPTEVEHISMDLLSSRNLDNLHARGFLYSSERILEVVNLISSKLYEFETKEVITHPGWRMINGKPRFWGYESESYAGTTKLSVSTVVETGFCLKAKRQMDKCPFKKRIGECADSDRCSVYANTFSSRPIRLSEHIEVVNSLIKDSLPLQMIISVSLSSAVTGYLNVANIADLNTPIVHLYGDSSKGKTTALEFAASMWGSPTAKSGLMHTWNATSAKILENLSNNNGVLFTLNELGSAMQTDYSNLVYCIAEGTGKDRMYNKNKTVHTWNTSVLSCGETSIVDMLDKSLGLYARIFEFFNLDITKSASHADEIKKSCNEFYGAIGLAFVKYILNHKEEIENEYKRLCQVVSRRIKKLSKISERLAKYIAVIALSAEIAHRLGLNVSFMQVREMLIDNHKQVVKEFPSWLSNLDDLFAYVSRNYRRFNKRNSEYEDLPDNYDGIDTARELIIITTVFDEFCKKLKIDRRLFLHSLKVNGYLKCPHDRYYTTQNVNGLRCKCYYIYKSRQSVPDTNIKSKTKSTKKNKSSSKTKSKSTKNPKIIENLKNAV